MWYTVIFNFSYYNSQNGVKILGTEYPLFGFTLTPNLTPNLG